MTDFRPDDAHDAVCASTERHLLVVAPPGTGKTHLAVRLGASIVPSLAAHQRILLLTFSNQARTQLEREADKQLTPPIRRSLEISNYHRFFWHGVLAYRRALGLPFRIQLVSRRSRKAAIERTAPDLAPEIARTPGLLDSLAEHAFPSFTDARTPPTADLARLLRIVDEEQRAGRLIFDDLGALFWSLLTKFDVVRAAYSSRYPVVIADEHQDASALQDAFVRLLGHTRLVVFADPMQLIHGFRGASPERLEQHRTDCGATLSLATPHRWHGQEHLALWLLSVRARLLGRHDSRPAPRELVVERVQAERGLGAVKASVRFAVLNAFHHRHCQSVAVLARSNVEVTELRKYLSEHGLRPWQIGGEDFEEAREDIEQLPLLRDSYNVALHCVDRLVALVATLSRDVADQVRRRLQPEGSNKRGAGQDALAILRALEPLYTTGATGYFRAMAAALDACKARGHHMPRLSHVQALRDTAEALGGTVADLDGLLDAYSARIVAATHAAPRTIRGLFVLTAHQAKGKEFDAVILANASRRFYPDNDESRRLFYVAVTRATKFWTVIAPDRAASPLLAALTGH